MKRIFLFSLIGILAGILSYPVGNNIVSSLFKGILYMISSESIMFLPGLIFGLFSVILIVKKIKSGLGKSKYAIWILGCCLSYFVSVIVCIVLTMQMPNISIFDSLSDQSIILISSMMAGMVGGFLLSRWLLLFIKKINIWKILAFMGLGCIGAIIPFLFLIFSRQSNSLEATSLFDFFLLPIWQGIIATYIGYLFYLEEKKSIVNVV